MTIINIKISSQMKNSMNETALPKVFPFSAEKAIFVWCDDPERDYCHVKILLDEIVSVVYSEGKRQCTLLLCTADTEKEIDTVVTLEEISAYLPKDQFVRIRWNELVNLVKVDKIQENVLYCKRKSFYMDKRFADNVLAGLTLADMHTRVSEANRMYYHEAIYIRDGECYVRVEFRHIEWITSYHNYCDIHVTNRKNPICSVFSLRKWMQYLPADHFLRINRSNIINVHCVDKISSGSYYIQGTELVVPRQHRRIISEFFHLVRRSKDRL